MLYTKEWFQRWMQWCITLALQFLSRFITTNISQLERDVYIVEARASLVILCLIQATKTGLFSESEFHITHRS